MKTGLFQSCGHCWVFQICWHTECSTFTASSFRTWNSSTGIPSHPLALFIVMLSKAHLTSYSRMSGSRSVITPLWLSGSWRSFLYSYSVYSCHLFLISSASVRSIPFLSFYRTRICPKCSLDISNFLEEISSLLEKGEEPEIKLPISTGSSKKQESFRKTSISDLLTMPKPLTVWITITCGKFWKWWEYQNTWPASWETCMQVRKQQL